MEMLIIGRGSDDYILSILFLAIKRQEHIYGHTIQKKRSVNVQQQHLLVQREFQLKGLPPAGGL